MGLGPRRSLRGKGWYEAGRRLPATPDAYAAVAGEDVRSAGRCRWTRG